MVQKIYLVQQTQDWFENNELKWSNLYAETEKTEAIKDIHKMREEEAINRKYRRKRYGKPLYYNYFKIETIELF